MLKTFNRIVAVLLVVSLVVDPTVAANRNWMSSTSQVQSQVYENQGLFKEQALQPVVLWMRLALEHLRTAPQVRNMATAAAISVTLNTVTLHAQQANSPKFRGISEWTFAEWVFFAVLVGAGIAAAFVIWERIGKRVEKIFHSVVNTSRLFGPLYWVTARLRVRLVPSEYYVSHWNDVHQDVIKAPKTALSKSLKSYNAGYIYLNELVRFWRTRDDKVVPYIESNAARSTGEKRQRLLRILELLGTARAEEAYARLTGISHRRFSFWSLDGLQVKDRNGTPFDLTVEIHGWNLVALVVSSKTPLEQAPQWQVGTERTGPIGYRLRAPRAVGYLYFKWNDLDPSRANEQIELQYTEFEKVSGRHRGLYTAAIQKVASAFMENTLLSLEAVEDSTDSDLRKGAAFENTRLGQAFRETPFHVVNLSIPSDRRSDPRVVLANFNPVGPEQYYTARLKSPSSDVSQLQQWIRRIFKFGYTHPRGDRAPARTNFLRAA
ncbi:MAG TPA: hypothetical protein VKC60_11265 [Opitutaceae bacterium]|nr:hypothetical protein [Opitutaceae bacterium]